MKDSVVVGRGEIAVQDMKNRLADGWTFSELWDRNRAAVMGGGYSYEYAEATESALSNS